MHVYHVGLVAIVTLQLIVQSADPLYPQEESYHHASHGEFWLACGFQNCREVDITL
jgi:hypothetical protein